MFEVFGDESAGERYATYGLVGITESEAGPLARKVTEAKAKFALTHVRLHCRVMFSGMQRGKMGLGQMSFDEVVEVYEEVVRSLDAFDTRLIYGQARLADFDFDMPAEGVWPEVTFGPKQLGVFCANAAILPLTKEFGAQNLRIWTDTDKTKINWLGLNRQASQAVGGWYDHGIGEPERAPPQTTAVAKEDERQVLFEVADLLAWLSNRVLAARMGDLNPRLRHLFKSLRPREMRVALDSNGGLRLGPA